MLVGDVKRMERPEIVTIPSRVRLDIVQDEIGNSVGSLGRWLLSFEEGVAASPVGTNREFGVPVGHSAIGLNEVTIAVVKGSPEVMQRISQDGWSMARHWLANHSRLPSCVVFLGAESFLVFLNPSFEYKLKLTDVVFGPLKF